jgi:acetylornithine/N-succinyldiaminopimelate aminotransferase
MISALLPNYARADLAFERGEGAWLWTVDGRRFLDFGSGIATASLGHGHPHLAKAIAEQAAKVMHVSNLYRIPGAEKLAQRLVDNTFADSVFFCLGRGANEGMIKMMRAMFDAGAWSASASSSSRAPSTAARWRPWPPPAMPSIWKASARWWRASTRCRSTT